MSSSPQTAPSAAQSRDPKRALVLTAVLAFIAGASVAAAALWSSPAPEAEPAPEPRVVQLLPSGSVQQLTVGSHHIDADPGASLLVGRVTKEGTAGGESPIVALLHGSVQLRAETSEMGAPLVVRAGAVELRARSAQFRVTMRRYDAELTVQEGSVAVMSAAGITPVQAGESWPRAPAQDAAVPSAP